MAPRIALSWSAPSSSTAWRTGPRPALRREPSSLAPSRRALSARPPSPPTPTANALSRALRLLPVVIAVPLVAYALSTSNVVELDGARSVEGKGARGIEVGDPVVVRPKDGLITAEQLESHNSRETGVWVVVDGDVWDVTDFLDLHPGGSKIILQHAGKDTTAVYTPIHPPNTIQKTLDPSKHVGKLDPAAAESVRIQKSSAETDDEERTRQARSELGHIDAEVINIADFERIAKKVLSRHAWAYYHSAADDGSARDHAHTAYERILFRPRVLRKVKDIDASTTILGVKSSLPIYISPAALARLGDEDGEMNLTKGAAAKSIIQVVSHVSSCSLEELNSVRQPSQPMMWQFYCTPDRAKSEASIKKAVSEGMNAIWVTVDTPVLGKRVEDRRFSLERDPPTDDKPTEHRAGSQDPNLSWEDLAWIRSCAPGLPLVVKGIQTAEDAALCVEHKVDGIVLSNHGGRQLEFSRPPIDVLQEIRRKNPEVLDSGMQIFVDGGIQRGSDVLKALCLGATAVGLGRPFLYAQSAYKTRGVIKAIDILEEEIHLGMRLLGVTRLDQLGPEYVECLGPGAFEGRR